MTEEKKVSAGVFDENRQEPIYTGDVYKENGAMLPYHKVIHDSEKGFMVHHLGCSEKFLLTTELPRLKTMTYMGNMIDNPEAWDTLTGEYKNEEIPEDAPESVKAFLNGDTDELPEDTEIISEEEAVELANNETVVIDMSKTDISETETPEETEPDTKTEENKTEETKDSEESGNEQGENIAVVASTKEEKRLQEQRNDYKKHVEVLKRKSDILETEAIQFENLASTLTHQPFVELRNLLSTAVQEKAKIFDVKEAQKHLNNLKAIDSMVAVLNEFKQKAEDNRANIELNKKEIDDYEIKIETINDKLTNFQQKLCFIEDTPEQEQKEEKTATAEEKNKKEAVENTATEEIKG